jgi:hypothetical protein
MNYATTALARSKGRLIRCNLPGSTPNRATILRTPARPGSASAARIRSLSWAAVRRAAQALALALGPRKPGADSLLNHRPFELGKYAHHLEHRLACRRRGVEAVPMQEQVACPTRYPLFRPPFPRIRRRMCLTARHRNTLRSVVHQGMFSGIQISHGLLCRR